MDNIIHVQYAKDETKPKRLLFNFYTCETIFYIALCSNYRQLITLALLKRYTNQEVCRLIETGVLATGY